MKEKKVETKIWVLRLFSLSWGILILLPVIFFDLHRLFLLPGVSLSLIGLLLPQWMRTPYALVEWGLAPLGHLLTLLILAFVFFGIFTPYAIILRLCGWDPLRVQAPRDRKTAWIRCPASVGRSGYPWQY